MRLFPLSVVLLLSWGALAVGGSPTWAGAPVAVFAVATAILGILEWRTSARSVGSALPHRAVILTLCLFVSAIGVQLLPLPSSVVNKLSPSHDVAEWGRLLAMADRRDPELAPTVSRDEPRSLSIAPNRTWLGLGFALALALYLIGASLGLSATGLAGVVWPTVILGAVVALVGIHYVASGARLLYGVYAPMAPSGYSAPFMNRNHQAGWLVMVLSLTIGLLVGEVARGLRTVAPTWRARTLWLSSKQANVGLLLVLGSVLMGVGVLATRSRSGTAIFVAALVVLAIFGSRRQSSKIQRRVVPIALAASVLISFAVNGAGVVGRTAGMSWFTDGRLAAWKDSLRILGDYWVTGTGFNTYGVSMLHYQTAQGPIKFIETHNDYLQLAVEGGLLLGVPALLLVLSLIAEIRRRFRERNDDPRTYWLRVGAVVGLLAMALQSTVDFTLQMPGAAVMFATLLAIAIHCPRPRVSAAERYAE